MPLAETVYQLQENEIHIWMIDPQQVITYAELHLILSAEEQQKIARYRSDRARHTALITRCFVRLLLSQYSPLAPQQWKFAISPLGKPELTNSAIPLRFNLSHNNEMIICAICLTKDIGCDIESLSRKISVNTIAKRFFSAPEYQLIKKIPTKFFEYWTLKEAFVKATGLGISQGLDTFSFEIKVANRKSCNDNIVLTFNKNSTEKEPQQWYHCLLFPDNTHCIGLSINGQKEADEKPTIRLFQNEQSTLLFNLNSGK